MRKAAMFIACFTVCLLSLTACSTSDTTQKTQPVSSNGTTTTTTTETVATTPTSSDNEDVVPPEAGPFTVLAEGVEADTICYYQGSENYPFCVIEKDGKFGVIDYAGNPVVPMIYNEIFLTTVEPYSEEIKLCIGDNYPTEVYWIEADGTLVRDEGYGGWGFEYSEDVCWYDGKPIIVDMFGPFDAEREYDYDEYCDLMSGYVTFGLDFTAYGLPSVIPIREVSELGEELTYASDNYALFDLKTAKLLTGFIYEDYSNGFVNGLMAVKRNGKWGYIRENGTVITGFVYDPVFHEESGEYSITRLYTPINGYIAVSQRGKWGIIDTDGKTVITPQFEDITQVDGQGRFWFKQNGTWTAAKLTK